MNGNKTLDQVAALLLVVGGLNWGLVGLIETDLVGELFGYGSTLADVVYVAVGLAAVYFLVTRLFGKKA